MGGSAVAQVVPPSDRPGHERSQFTEPPAPLSRPAGALIQLPATLAPDAASGIKLKVRRVVVEGATVYTMADLEPLYAGLLGRQVSAADVYALTAQIVNKHGAAGYPSMRRMEEGQEEPSEIHFLKGYTVFNVEQIYGLPESYYGRPSTPREGLEAIAHAEAFFRETAVRIVHGGSRACYVQHTDTVHMPFLDTFRDAESYYATLAHESTHWTKHPQRLDRNFGRKRGAMKAMRWKNSSPNSAPPCSAPTSISRRDAGQSCQLHRKLASGAEE
jgi:hypothetical protein